MRLIIRFFSAIVLIAAGVGLVIMALAYLPPMYAFLGAAITLAGIGLLLLELVAVRRAKQDAIVQTDEFFISDSKFPQKKCPKCAMAHDFDLSQCPHCRHKY